jgi:hypothetical protein
MSSNVSLMPSMDELGLFYFKEAVNNSKCYLEYGSGGSTIFAANVAKVPSIISVESDKKWNENVKSSVDNSISRLYIEHCDIGDVIEWGYPMNKNKVDTFWQYSFKPWDTANKNSLIPDTVLIDGRFRVCSFLTSLLCSQVGTRLLFDDYFDRPHYFVVEEICQLHERHGRMAVFISNKNYSYINLSRMIAKYSVDAS